MAGTDLETKLTKMKHTLTFLASLLLSPLAGLTFAGSAQGVPATESKLSLWYRQAATNWTEALPLGNGRLGAMVLRLADIELAPQNRLDPPILRRGKKVHRPVDIPVVRHGDRSLPQVRHPVHQLLNVTSPVQQGIFRMQMKMRKFGHG